MAGVNSTGLYATNAGYITNSTGASVAGLSGYGSGDMIFYANSSQVMRFYTGTTCKIAMGANSIYLDIIRAFSGSTGTQLFNDSGFSVVNNAGSSQYFSTGSGGCYFYVNGSQSAFNSNSIYSPALGGYSGRGFFLTASGGASCYPAICHAWNNPGATGGSTYCTTLATSSQYTVYLPSPASGIYGFSYNWGGTGFGFPSDGRLKDDITPMKNHKAKFMKLNPCEYHYKSDKDKRRRYGFIAQELQAVYPDHVYESEITEKDDNGNEYKPLLVTQTDLIPVMVDQIQVLHKTVDDQQATIQTMAKHITTLTDTLNALLAKYPI
jgi:hypothetical protein